LERIFNRSAVLLFIKSPEPGKVKSRLAKAIGEDAALDVYKCLVSYTLENLKTCNYLFRLCFYPPGSGAIIKSWLGSTYHYAPQHGRDLGERMKSAFVQAFSDGVEKVLVIGSDIPDLSISLINEAFNALDTSDAVIGPAHDGGYYLIGFNRASFLSDIFQGIVWSTDSVFYQTMKIFEKSGLHVHVLTGLRDVDTFEDLLSLFKRDNGRIGEPGNRGIGEG
jgi:rSAM/selenodomain-associated transferase 1